MTEQKTTQITNINLQIDKIKKQISEGNESIKKYIEKRNMLHQQVKQSREEINKIKAERDALNERVKLLKQQRDAVRANTDPIMDEIKTLQDKIEALKKNLPRVSQRQLKEELDSIEWKISTTSLDLKEEKELIEQVKALEIQLSGYKKIDAQRKKINELLEHRKNFDTQADAYHQELTDLAKKSQDLHAMMMQKMEALKKDRAEADSLHQAFIKTKEQNNLLYAQLRLLYDQSAGIKVAIREQNQARWREEDAKRKEELAKRKEEQAQKAAKEKEIKEKIGSQAKERLQRGEEVSWDELQLMYSENTEDEAES
ncbi:MAG: hypothetical protein NWE98_08610 [Candidatus Bathyarchaeota archaeon]|nr:hypothetical protein [Candidatus Bathyarchaeota archaeon]